MVYVSNRTKTFNEQIYYAINSIQEGIFSGLEIHFKYYEYTVEKRKQLRHGGEVYTVSPYSLVWENDNYYLIIKIALWVSSTQSAFACVNIITYSPLCCQLFADILRKFYITP